MAHTYTSEFVHCVFSTQGRHKTIPADLQPKLWAYLGGIARRNGFRALAVGGTEDHVHVLISLPASIPLAKAVQLLKGGSSKWIHDSTGHAFAWQEGYGHLRWESRKKRLLSPTLLAKRSIMPRGASRRNSLLF